MAGLIEERGIETVFRNNPSLCHILSFLVRTGNTFLGRWVRSAGRRTYYAASHCVELSACGPRVGSHCGDALLTPPPFPFRGTLACSLLWVDYLRLLGLQKASGADH